MSAEIPENPEHQPIDVLRVFARQDVRDAIDIANNRIRRENPATISDMGKTFLNNRRVEVNTMIGTSLIQRRAVVSGFGRLMIPDELRAEEDYVAFDRETMIFKGAAALAVDDEFRISMMFGSASDPSQTFVFAPYSEIDACKILPPEPHEQQLDLSRDLLHIRGLAEGLTNARQEGRHAWANTLREQIEWDLERFYDIENGSKVVCGARTFGYFDAAGNAAFYDNDLAVPQHVQGIKQPLQLPDDDPRPHLILSDESAYYYQIPLTQVASLLNIK